MYRASVERVILARIASSFWDHASRRVARIGAIVVQRHSGANVVH